MRILLLLFISFYSISAISQFRIVKKGQEQPFLVAENIKHSRWYREGKPLRITYRNGSGNMVISKGRLFINDRVNIELDRRRGKIVSVINPDDIISIERWSGPEWKEAGVLAGIGAAIGIPTFMALAKPPGNLALIAPALVTILLGYYIAIDIPIIILSKLLSVRSQKKGYHFSIRYD